MQSLLCACPIENSGAWIVGILWHSLALGGSCGMARLPLPVPVVMQLLVVGAVMPLPLGSSLSSGAEMLARLVVHPVFAAIVSSSLSAWKGLLARSALIGLGEGAEQWCVVEIGSLNVTVSFFGSPQRLHLGIR